MFSACKIGKYNPKTAERVATAQEKGGHNIHIIDNNINTGNEQSQNETRTFLDLNVELRARNL